MQLGTSQHYSSDEALVLATELGECGCLLGHVQVGDLAQHLEHNHPEHK